MRKDLDEELAMEVDAYIAYIEGLTIAEFKEHVMEAVTYCTMTMNFVAARMFLEILPILLMVEKEGKLNEKTRDALPAEAPHFFK